MERNMRKEMCLEINYLSGPEINRKLIYTGESIRKIDNQIWADKKSLLEYMQTHNFNGEKSFCFAGFIFQKAGIVTAELYEPNILR